MLDTYLSWKFLYSSVFCMTNASMAAQNEPVLSDEEIGRFNDSRALFAANLLAHGAQHA